MKIILTTLVRTLLICSNLSLAAGRSKPVIVDSAEIRQLAPTVLYTGISLSKNDIRIGAEIEGRLTSIVEVGSVLKQGQAIATLDDIFLQQQKQEELATIASEQASVALFKKQVQRYQALLKSNSIARDQLDQTQASLHISESDLRAAQARLMQIKERIYRSKIIAPYNGVVTERTVQIGEWLKTGDTIVRFIELNNSEIQVYIAAQAINLIQIGSRLEISLNQQSSIAVVSSIVPASINSSRLFEVRLTPETTIPPGTLVRVRLPFAAARSVVSIHRDALVLRKGSTTVFKVNADNIAEQVVVDVGIGDGDYIEVIGDIAAGDAVVVRGGERLRAGTAVSSSRFKQNR